MKQIINNFLKYNLSKYILNNKKIISKTEEVLNRYSLNTIIYIFYVHIYGNVPFDHVVIDHNYSSA